MEQRKVLLIIVSITFILAATIGVGLLLYYPRDEAPEATAGTEYWDPMDFLAGSGSRPGLGAADTDVAETDPADGTAPESTDGSSIDEDEGSFSVTYGVREGIRPTDDPDAQTPGSRVGAPSVTIREEDESRAQQQSVSQTARADESTGSGQAASTAARSSEAGSSSRRATTAEPAPVATSSRPTVTSEQTLASRAYWVQVISSPNRDTIEQARRTLGDHQIHTRVLTKEIGGTVYYRLRLGPFAVREEAEKFLDWILDLDRYADALIFVDYTTGVRAPSGS